MSVKLEAVNLMLKAIGETPVSSLETGLEDVASAVETLDVVKRNVLEKGWEVNTEFEVRFALDVNGQVRVADNILRIDPTDQGLKVTVKRDPSDSAMKLYDTRKRTFTFSKALVCDVVYDMDFEDLPIAMRQYIAARAARTFQEGTVGSAVLDKFRVRAETEAWGEFQDAEAEAEDLNTLRDSAHVASITYRNNRTRGY